MTEFRPKWASHVVGTFQEPRADEDGRPEPTKVFMHCETCGERWQTTCASGAPRQWVLRYAVAHVHRDRMDPGKR